MLSIFKDRCQELASPDIANFSVSVFIVIGILVSYLPQHYKLISRKSSRGLSPLFVLLGMVSGTASIANIITLPESQRDLGCCPKIGSFACAAALLGVAQITVQWLCFLLITFLFLVFFNRPVHSSTATEDDEDATIASWQEAVMVLTLSVLFLAFAFLGSVVFYYVLPSHIRGWANFLGVVGTLLAALQYIPQIITTYRLQQLGSLSVPMMCIQTPGSFVFAASLAVRLGPAGWSAWGLFILTGCLQGCLLAMSLTFLYRDHKAMKQAAAFDSSAPTSLNGQAANGSTPRTASESTPLLTEQNDLEDRLTSQCSCTRCSKRPEESTNVALHEDMSESVILEIHKDESSHPDRFTSFPEIQKYMSDPGGDPDVEDSEGLSVSH